MSPLQSHNKPWYRRWWVLPISIVLLLFALNIFAPRFLFDFIGRIAEPIWQVRDEVYQNVRHALGTNGSRALQRENEALRREVNTLRQQLASSNEIPAATSTAASRLHAVVYTKPPFSPYDSLHIGVGARDGVDVGDPVYTTDNVFIGRISDTASTISQVRLFSAPDFTLNVELENGVQGEASGVGSGNLRIRLPRDLEIATGTPVVSGEIPREVVGRVEYIERSPNESFQYIFIRIPFQLFEAREVFVDTSVGT